MRTSVVEGLMVASSWSCCDELVGIDPETARQTGNGDERHVDVAGLDLLEVAPVEPASPASPACEIPCAVRSLERFQETR
jgi:hypothetical protein